MASVADLLGVTGIAGEGTQQYRLNHQSRRQARLKGLAERDVLAAANQPWYSMPNVGWPSQRRHIRNGVVAVVNDDGQIVTVYLDKRGSKMSSFSRDVAG